MNVVALCYNNSTMQHFATFLYKCNIYLLNYYKFGFYILFVLDYQNKLQQKNQHLFKY